jgi:hypothetical protein
MARREHQPQQVVSHVVVYRRVEIGCRSILLVAELVAELLVLAIEQRAPAELIDRAVFRRGHEPGSRIVRDTRLWPLLKGRDQRVLREVFGQAHVADASGQSGDEPGGFDAPHGVDGALNVGSRHGYRSAYRVRYFF